MPELDDRYIDEFLFLRVIANDDKKSFKIIFIKYYSCLMSFANKYVHSIEESEDIVQDVFFNIWKCRKKISIDSSVKGFLTSSVKNKSLDYIRKNKSKIKYMNSHTLSNDEYISQDSSFALVEMQEVIDKAILKLPKKVKEVFLMNRSDGLRYRDIAQKKDISVKTVEAYMSKALNILRCEVEKSDK